MSMILDGSNGVTFNDASLQGAAASPYVLKNRIINGAMVIDQRNAGASITPTSTTGIVYTVDRWGYRASQASKVSIQQNAASVTPPVGFSNYLGITSLSSYSITSSDFFVIRQFIEGYNVADLNWGTANAATVTLSFQVYSSLTGTFGGALVNSASDRSYPFTYTISTANTWTQISVTIPGDTSGTWLTTNGSGIRVDFGLGVGATFSGTAGAWAGASYQSATGATSVVGTNGATFYITGVQLEQNTSATPFERRLYGQELVNCQRYYYRIGGGTGSSTTATRSTLGGGYTNTTTNTSLVVPLPVTMRSAPTLNFGGSITVSGSGYSATPSDVTISAAANTSSVSLTLTVSVTTAGLPRDATVRTDTDPDAFVDFSAEL
jgi:hypothetical protein